MLETVIDHEGNLVYTKMHNNDPRVGTLLTLVKSKNEKLKKDVILLEGKRLIKDALLSGCKLKHIIFSRVAEVEYLKPHLPKVGVSLYKMPYREMQMWSDLTTNPGIMGIFKTPDVENFIPQESLPFIVICDNIREPGNLGTILRICAAAGCEKVVLTKGCANVWETKVLRSAMGAHFKLKIHKNVEWDSVEKLLSVDGDSDVRIYVADNKVISDSINSSSGELETILEQLHILPYYGVDFNRRQQTVLIVGGETLGLSKTAYEMALKMNGLRLNIPLSNEVDSLNVGCALGIIVFELKRQLMSEKP